MLEIRQMPSFLRDSQIISQNQVRRKNNVKDIVQLREYDILTIWENHRAKGGFTPLFFRRVQVALQTKESLLIKSQVFFENLLKKL